MSPEQRAELDRMHREDMERLAGMNVARVMRIAKTDALLFDLFGTPPSHFNPDPRFGLRPTEETATNG